MTLSKKLFTWVDVEDVFSELENNQELPDWIIWIRVYWSGLVLGVKPDSTDITITWIRNIFSPRFDPLDNSIILESEGMKNERRLSIDIEELERFNSKQIITPTFARPSVLSKNVEIIKPDLPLNSPPIIVFHSFKGGVGKTLTAITLASLISENEPKRRVLLIDGDLEAPGISWTLSKRIPDPPIAYSDLLAIIHSDPDPNLDSSLDLISNYLENSIVDNIIVLPSYRTREHFNRIQITPESLTKNIQNPYILTTFLASLGKKLNVSTIIVDLRAGLSELSAGLILDSRVNRVLVTSLNPQSIEGTCNLLNLISLRPDSKPQSEDDPIPFVIINQIPIKYQKSYYNEERNQLLNSLNPFLPKDQENITDFPIIEIEQKESLFVISKNWDQIREEISSSSFKSSVKQLSELFTISSYNIESSMSSTIEEVIEYRKRIENFAYSMIYSDNNQIDKFLTTNSIKDLVTRFSNQVPIAIIMGPKGSGKTYLYNQFTRRIRWDVFAREVSDQEHLINSFILPVIQSRNSIRENREKALFARSEVAKMLKSGNVSDDLCISDFVGKNLARKFSDKEWRQIWLQCIAASAGYNIDDTSSWDSFLMDLKREKKSIIAIFDGLEDLFQDIYSNENQIIALRSLLQDIPRYLEQIPGNNVGIMVFVRKDIASHSISQNFSQFEARYSAYQLKWELLDALRLVKWVILESGYDKFSSSDISQLKKDELLRDLLKVWGKKLGKDNAKESNSAQWVIGALSDFNGQIQPRDIVRFLHLAAEKSQSEGWPDRLLTPTAIRKSIKECSLEKLDEVKRENKQIEPILVQLDELDQINKKIPFIAGDLQLNKEQIALLKENGMILIEGELCYMPEIIRQGLSFTYSAGARPRVIMYSKQRLNWN
jgi:MinD-like ATPase involved in chromosome partitioning or flagellar assembly